MITLTMSPSMALPVVPNDHQSTSSLLSAISSASYQDDSDSAKGAEAAEAAGNMAAYWISLLAMTLLTVMALFSNVSVGIAVLSCSQLRTTWNNCFVLNLCLTEALAALVVLPLSIASYVSQPEELTTGWCLFGQFLHTSLVHVVSWTVCLISIDRHYMILMPMVHAVELTLFRTLVAVLVVWLVSVLPSGYLIVSQENDPRTPVCCGWGLGVSSSSAGYVLTVAILEFLLPAITMFSMYASIFRVARRAVRGVDEPPAVSTISGRLADREVAPMQSLEAPPHLPVFQADDNSIPNPVVSSFEAQTSPKSVFSFWKRKSYFRDVENNGALRKLKYKSNKIMATSPRSSQTEGPVKVALVESVWESVSWVIGNPTSNTFVMASNSHEAGFHRANITNMKSIGMPNGERTSKVAAMKAARTLLLVIGTFWIMYLPYYVFNIYLALAHLESDTYSDGVEQSIAIIREIMEKPSGMVDRQDFELLQDSFATTFNTSSLTCTAIRRSQVGEQSFRTIEVIAHLTEWLLYCTFAINPFLYGLLNRAIRTQLTKMSHEGWDAFWSLCRSKKKVQPSSSASHDLEAEGDIALEPPSLENILEFLQKTNYVESQLNSPGRPRHPLS